MNRNCIPPSCLAAISCSGVWTPASKDYFLVLLFVKYVVKSSPVSLSPRSQFLQVQVLWTRMVYDGWNLVSPRYNQKKEPELFHQLDLTLPEQSPPKIEELKKKCADSKSENLGKCRFFPPMAKCGLLDIM